MKKAKNFKDALMYIFEPPGWSPDGTTLTVKEMQREQKVKATLQPQTVEAV